VLQSGEKLPWQKKENEVKVMCPDPDNTVIIVLRRIKNIDNIQWE